MEGRTQMPWTRIVVAIAFTVLLAGPTSAQEPVPVVMPPAVGAPAVNAQPVTAPTIIGTIVDAGRVMPDASVQLRNAASGRVVSRTIADETGEFTFTAVAPGTYVLEQVDDRDRVIAYGEIFDLSPAQTRVTVFETSDAPQVPTARNTHRDSTGRGRTLWLSSAAAVAGVIVIALGGR